MVFHNPLSIFEKQIFFDDENFLFSRPKNLLFTKDALESFIYVVDLNVINIYL